VNFVDANVVVYAEAEPDPAVRNSCRQFLAAVSAGRLNARCSTAVIEEVWHVELRGRPPMRAGVARKTFLLFRPLLTVTDEIVQLALDLDVTGIGSSDRIHAATCLDAGITTIISADAAFDHVAGLRRVDPRERGAVQALIGSNGA
jgi:predicted nucleic acid-binding protein